MPGKKFPHNYWKSLSFQEQVEQNKVAESGPVELIIPKEKTKKQSKKKKKTATTIHLEIKKILEDDTDYSAHLKAQSVLDKAKKNGYKGKRLQKWSLYLEDYFKESKEKMGSSSRNLWQREEIKKLNSTPPESEKTLPKKESVDNEPNKEKQEMVEIDIPDLPLEDEEAETVEDKSVQDESGGSVVFGIVGAGQCGGRLAESFYNLGYKKTIAVNTAEHDLNGLSDIPTEQRVLMDTGTGGGAGKDMRLGESAADKHQQAIYEKMQEVFGEVDRIIVCAGAGGGTGGGSCLRLVETAKKYLSYLGVEDVNSKVGVLLTLPTVGETKSPTVAENAHLLTSKLVKLAEKNEVSPLLLFDNSKIKKMYPKLSPKKFWPTVNATVTGLFHMFNVLSNQPSEITSFDPADYSRLLSSGGCMTMGMTTLKEYSEGTDISKAIRSNLEKGLLCGGFDVSTAKAAACIATASEDMLDNTPMDALETGFDTLANITGNAIVFRGIYEVNKDKFVVYTAVTGLNGPDKRLEELKKLSKNKATKTKLYD
jgi:cell division GTPase FtsZ